MKTTSHSFSLSAFGLAVLLATAGNAHAQDVPAAPPAVLTAEPSPAEPSPASDEREERLAKLEGELQRMAQELAAQRAELAQQRAALDEQKQQAELASLTNGSEQEAALEAQNEPFLRVYGFADVGVQRTWGPVAELVPGGSQKTTFVLGNVNFYFDSNPLPDWRFLTELRVGLFPQGAAPRGLTTMGGRSVDTTIGDDTASNGGFTNIVWNGVLLERSHIDWTPRDEINIRAGWWLTPYGIWNVDHGSPTRLVIEPPMFITTDMFPQRQLGLQVFGQFQALPWTLGYVAYISNGRTPGQVDFSDDKALGGRLWARTRHPYPLTLGLSGYTGRFEQVDKTTGLRPDGTLFATSTETVAYRDYAGGVDVAIDMGPLRIRSEGVFRWKLFEDGKRSVYVPGTTDPDQMTFGAYVMAAYQLPWYGLEPVFITELVRFDLPVGEYGGRIGGGLNIYLSAVTTLRTSYVYSELFDVQGPERALPYNNFHSVASRLIIAF